MRPVRVWFIIKLCGNLAARISADVTIPTPEPQLQSLLAEVLVDALTLYTCAAAKVRRSGDSTARHAG